MPVPPPNILLCNGEPTALPPLVIPLSTRRWSSRWASSTETTDFARLGTIKYPRDIPDHTSHTCNKARLRQLERIAASVSNGLSCLKIRILHKRFRTRGRLVYTIFAYTQTQPGLASLEDNTRGPINLYRYTS